MRKLITGLALGVALLLAHTAKADPILDFTIPSVNPGASITYSGGSNPLIGSGLRITDVTGINTPSNDFANLGIVNGQLNFTSGALTGSTANSWSFGTGGSITITGTIPTLGINTTTILMTGQFTNSDPNDLSSPGLTIIRGLIRNNTTLVVAGGAFLNTVNPTLRAYYGLAGATQWSGGLNVQFVAKGKLNGGDKINSTEVLSGDVATSPVLPEPGTIVMAGLGGVICLGIYGRKMLARRAV